MNLFGGAQKKNPLAALLMQPDMKQLLMQQQAPPQEQPQGAPLQAPINPTQGMQMMRQPPPQEPPPPDGGSMGGKLLDFMNTPMGAGGDKPRTPFSGWTPADYLLKTNPVTLPATLVVEKALEGKNPARIGAAVSGVTGNKPVTQILDDILSAGGVGPKGPVNAPPKADEFVGPPAPEQQEPNFSTTDEQQKSLDLATGGGLFKGALDATQDILSKYGKMAQTAEGAKVALKKEFQDTPELDDIIAKTEGELATARAGRKQPGVGEFIALALMNLSNHDYKNNAYMVLGTGEQMAKENQLENRLSDLQGARATARMHGRQQLRGMESQQKYQNLQAALRQQEMGRKQGNEDREFGFKGQKLGYDKLMQELGQLRQQAGLETDPSRKKKLQELIDKLDPYGQSRQQIPTPPKDDRQSRMFGDMLGGGYA